MNIPKHGSHVRTLITTYGAPQKQQIANLTKIPAGSVGVVRYVGQDSDTAVYVLTIFRIDGKKLFVKLGLTTIEEFNNDQRS